MLSCLAFHLLLPRPWWLLLTLAAGQFARYVSNCTSLSTIQVINSQTICRFFLLCKSICSFETLPFLSLLLGSILILVAKIPMIGVLYSSREERSGPVLEPGFSIEPGFCFTNHLKTNLFVSPLSLVFEEIP